MFYYRIKEIDDDGNFLRYGRVGNNGIYLSAFGNLLFPSSDGRVIERSFIGSSDASERYKIEYGIKSPYDDSIIYDKDIITLENKRCASCNETKPFVFDITDTAIVNVIHKEYTRVRVKGNANENKDLLEKCIKMMTFPK